MRLRRRTGVEKEYGCNLLIGAGRFSVTTQSGAGCASGAELLFKSGRPDSPSPLEAVTDAAPSRNNGMADAEPEEKTANTIY